MGFGRDLTLDPLFTRDDTQFDIILPARHKPIYDNYRLVRFVVYSYEHTLPRCAVHSD